MGAASTIPKKVDAAFTFLKFGRPRHPLSGCGTHSRFDRRSSGLFIPGVRRLEASRNQAIADYDSAQHRAFARTAADVWRIHQWGPLRRGPCTPRYQTALTATLKQW